MWVADVLTSGVRRRRRHALLVGSMFLPMFLALGWGPAAWSKSNLTSLVAQLSDPLFAKREAAEAALLALGEGIVPELEERLAAARDPERRMRMSRCIQSIQNQVLRDGFAQLRRARDEAIDLEDAMYWIARLVDPAVSRRDLDAAMNRLADPVRMAIAARKPAPGPEARFAILLDHVYRVEGFSGDEETYDDPDNSAIHRVIERKRGLPILLSHLLIALGDRCDVPLVGLQVPGRYMIRLDAADVPLHQIRIVSPFDGPTLYSLAELQRLGHRPVIEPSSHADTVTRMLRNLESDFQEAGLFEQATLTAEMMAVFLVPLPADLE